MEVVREKFLDFLSNISRQNPNIMRQVTLILFYVVFELARNNDADALWNYVKARLGPNAGKL